MPRNAYFLQDGYLRSTHSEKISLPMRPTNYAEELTVRRIVALLNAADKLPVEAFPEHAERLAKVAEEVE
jgi:hypothetical protein